MDKALDVWFKFENPDDEETQYEANTYRNSDGTYRVEWYHTAVGQISSRTFQSYGDAVTWLELSGFQDFTCE